MSKRKKEYATDVLKREIEERKTKLKRCPFCNGEAKVKEFKFGLNAVYCDSCGARITAFYMNNAIIAWNKRVDVAKTDESCEKSCKDENATCKKSLQLTRLDIEEMVNLKYEEFIHNEWIADCGTLEIKISKDDEIDAPFYIVYINSEIADEAFNSLSGAKKYVKDVVVGFVCSALGVE